jgi:hypothetical protein
MSRENYHLRFGVKKKKKKKKKKNFKRPNNDYSKISSAKSMRG